MSDTHSTTSSSVTDTLSSCCDKLDSDTPATAERGFLATPNGSLSNTNTSSMNGTVELDSPPTGLVTQTSEFVRNERKAPSIDAHRVAMPDGAAHTKQVYKNRPSGSATLPHPLTLQTAGDAHLTNGTSDSVGSFFSPASFVEHFLGPNGSVS